MTPSGSAGAKLLKLPEPRPDYDRRSEIFKNTVMEEADQSNFKHFQDIDLANGERLILVSANGTRYSVTVTNAGVLGTTAV
tara:strand:- start:555 stop:797 length:243 start_codon:yes stop_codon:yes gene_type:complete